MDLRIAICDDESSCIDVIEKHIIRLKEEYDKINYDVFYSGEELLSRYNEEGNIYDIVILDIELSNVNGIKTAEFIREKDKYVNIFFLTSHTNYAIQCFKVSPKNFWVKPLSYEEFYADVKRVIDDFNSERDVFCYNFRGVYERIAYDDIIYFSSDNKKINIVCKDKIYTFNGTLKNYSDEFKKENFISPHKSYYINIKHAIALKNNDLIMRNGDIIPVSKSRKADVKIQMSRRLHRERVAF